jgi:hypothetical protein
MGRRRGGWRRFGWCSGRSGPPRTCGLHCLCSVDHPGHGADPRFNAEPPSNAASSCGGLPTAVPPPTIASQIDGTSRGDLPVVTRGAAPTLVISADLSRTAFARSRSRARAMDRPSQRGYGRGRGSRVCWGQAPEQCRSARPRVKARGRGVCNRNQAQGATGATDTYCAPYGRLPARQRTDPHEPRSQRPWQHREALRASLGLIPLLPQGHTERDDEGGRG